MMRRRLWRIATMALALLLALSALPALAVSGGAVAADGVYASYLTAYKYKYGSWIRPIPAC